MESLEDTKWDVVIAGTGLPQSLLALALSRSGKKILHIDRNDYYGGDEAALSLTDADKWAEEHANTCESRASFGRASIFRAGVENEPSGKRLLSPRAYSLALAPQLIYARSNLIPSLVSSQLHNQLDFQAVGSFFLLHGRDGESNNSLTRIPGGREDVFQDTSLDLRAKRSLMKFLRSVAGQEEQQATWEDERDQTLSSHLETNFGIPSHLQQAISALSLSSLSPSRTTVGFAIPRIARHLTSIGVFGPGFSAVLPKWGGLAELGQVACRACAVGGGVYVLGRGIASVDRSPTDGFKIKLSDDYTVTAQHLAGCAADLPNLGQPGSQPASIHMMLRSISIVASQLSALFPPTSEGGVTPAGAVVLVPSASPDQGPVHLLIHSSESGECPSGQCVIYASAVSTPVTTFQSIETAIDRLLAGVGEEPEPKLLWRMQYEQSPNNAQMATEQEDCLHLLRPLPDDLALEDDVLEDVRSSWLRITGADADSFLRFEQRDGTIDDDDDGDAALQ